MKQKSKWITPLITVVVLIALIATSVFAYYLKSTEAVKNTFKPADSVVPKIIETFDDKTLKKDVYFNVGETKYPVYVRAAIIITWQDKDGNVYFSKPIEDTDYYSKSVDDTDNSEPKGDYAIDINTDDWEKRDDGFYYFQNSVVSGGNTSNLINKCEQIREAPVDGYTLSVEIIVQTVQAIGSTDGENNTPEEAAWKDAWVVS